MNSEPHIQKPREPTPEPKPIPIDPKDIFYFRKRLLEMSFRESDERIRTALDEVAKKDAQILKSKEEVVLSHLIDWFFDNPPPPESSPPSTPPIEEHLLFMGLESDPICFNRKLPESNIPAVLDFADEEKRIIAGINKAKCQV